MEQGVIEALDQAHIGYEGKGQQRRADPLDEQGQQEHATDQIAHGIDRAV